MIKLFLCYFSANAKILFGKEPPFTSKLMATTDIAAGEVIEQIKDVQAFSWEGGKVEHLNRGVI